MWYILPKMQVRRVFLQASAAASVASPHPMRLIGPSHYIGPSLLLSNSIWKIISSTTTFLHYIDSRIKLVLYNYLNCLNLNLAGCCIQFKGPNACRISVINWWFMYNMKLVWFLWNVMEVKEKRHWHICVFHFVLVLTEPCYFKLKDLFLFINAILLHFVRLQNIYNQIGNCTTEIEC